MYYDPYTPRHHFGCLGGLIRSIVLLVLRLLILLVIVGAVLKLLGMYFPAVDMFLNHILERLQTLWLNWRAGA